MTRMSKADWIGAIERHVFLDDMDRQRLQGLTRKQLATVEDLLARRRRKR